jgi:hypothetical protein
LLATGVGAGAVGAVEDVGLGLGLAEDDVGAVGVVLGEPLGVVDGDTLGVVDGDTLGEVDGDTLGDTLGDVDGDTLGDAAGQVCDRLNHGTCFAPSCVSTIAEALWRTAPGAEPAYACLSLGGPNVVIVWLPPGLNVTVRDTKSVSLPGRTKAQPSCVFGMLPHCASWPLKPAAVIGVA